MYRAIAFHGWGQWNGKAPKRLLWWRRVRPLCVVEVRWKPGFGFLALTKFGLGKIGRLQNGRLHAWRSRANRLGG
jgi:hypothetical protein